MTNTNDLRYVKNHQLIKDTFLKLLRQKGYAKTTVSQIIADAKINRSTFYVHFQDKEDLMENIQDELLDQLLSSLPALNLANLMDGKVVDIRIERMADNVYQHRELLQLFLNDQSEDTFSQHLVERARKELFTTDIVAEINIPIAYLGSSMASLLVNLMITWAKRDFQESPAEFAQIVKRIAPHFLKSLVQGN